MIDYSRVFHFGFVVRNMDRAVRVWERQGARLVVPPGIDPIQNVSCALFAWEGAAAVELIAPLPEGPNPVKSRLEKGGGLDHICLFADDVDKELVSFVDRGALPVVAPCYGAVFDRTLAFVQTREGMTVELMSRLPLGRMATDPLAEFRR